MRSLLLACLLIVSAAPAAAGDSATLLARMESADDAVQGAAEDEWDALDEATQVRLARAALAEPAAPGALEAARRLSPWSLDLAELGRQARALLRQPEIDERSLPACIGAPQVLGVWSVAGERTGWFEELHRVTTADALGPLTEGADEAPDAQWSHRVWTVRNVAWHTDRDRERVAALLAQDLRRWPGVDLPRPARAASGLPPHFETIARCAWGLERHAERGVVLSRVVPWAWLLRWAGDVTPTAADLPFLDAVVLRAEDDPEARAWAVRHRVRLSGAEAAPWLISLLDDDEGPDCEALLAAHLALLGHEERWQRVFRDAPDEALTCPLLWRLDPATAAATAVHEYDLGVQGRAELERVWGVRIGRAELDGVARSLASRGTREELIAFLAKDHPEGVRGELAEVLCDRLASAAPGDDLAGDDLWTVLGLLEVRARDRLVPLLRTWAGRGGALREIALNALIELREDVDSETAWASWEARDGWGPWEDASTIGLHPDPVVGERLRAAARSSEESADAAAAALARRAGLSRSATWAVGAFLGDVDAEARGIVIEALVEDRPADALRALFDATEEELLVLHLDPTDLRDLRARREDGLYWHATLGLALAGDAAAAAEIDGLLAENRTLILDALPLETDPRVGRRFARRHAERLAHNCCARFQSVVALRAAYPTLPAFDDWTLEPQHEIALAWLDAHAGEAAFSRIANGWLPR